MEAIKETSTRKSFREAYRSLGDDAKDRVRNGYLDAGNSLSSFYNHMNGLKPISDDNEAVLISLFKVEKVKSIWD